MPETRRLSRRNVLAGTAAAAAACRTPPPPVETHGDWKLLPYESQIEAVHAALLPSGKVLYYSGFRYAYGAQTETRLWIPKTGEIRTVPTPGDLFCAGHCHLPDGRILSTGGTLEYRNVPRGWFPRFAARIASHLPLTFQRWFARHTDWTFTGPTFLYLFDPATEQWHFATEMEDGRWYPTNTVLPDGRVLILAGWDAGGGFARHREADSRPEDHAVRMNMRIEVFDQTQGLRTVGVIQGEAQIQGDEHQHHGFPSLYPRIFVLPRAASERDRYPAGRAFCAGEGPETRWLDLHTWTWQEAGKLNFGTRHDGCAVLLPLRPPDYRPRVLTFGGSILSGIDAEATASAEVVDLGADPATWREIASMKHPRVNAAAVALPDGRILAVGGNSRGRWTEPAYEVELFDPRTDQWSVGAPMEVPRGYHATALLLPDARVFVSGTTPLGDYELRIELYAPDYLFKGKRPVIATRSAGSLPYGGVFAVEYGCEEGEIRRAALIRLGSMTHAFDMDQRYVELEILDGAAKRPASGTLALRAPPDPFVAPPGHYMLFLLNERDVPSEAAIVHLSGPPPQKMPAPRISPLPGGPHHER